MVRYYVRRRSFHQIRAGIQFTYILVFSLAALSGSVPLQGQVSLATVERLGLQQSARIKLAEDDLARAKAVCQENKDIYIPSLGAAGGAGASYGITLNVPTIFTMNAQSLVFSYQQRDYLRASKLDLQAAELVLADVREAVEEDIAVTYVMLDRSQQMASVLSQETELAAKLQDIVEQRKAAGLEDEVAMDEAQRSSIQTRLQELEMEDQVASLQGHLSELTGMQSSQMVTVGESIPAFRDMNMEASNVASAVAAEPSVLAAVATAQARRIRAQGDLRFLWKPQISLEAQYGRVSPINSVSDYYNLHGNYNTASAGVVIQFPFFDAARKQRGRESEIDAHHAAHEADLQRSERVEDRLKLLRALSELKAKEQMAALNYKIAKKLLDTTLVQTKAGGYDGPPLTPKDELKARLEERQKYLDLLDAKLQLQKSRIFFLRKEGNLDSWITSQQSPTPQSSQ